jgi:hypothetical protein
MGFFDALLGALEPVAQSGVGFATSFGFIFQPPSQPGYVVKQLPGGQLTLSPSTP